MEYEQPPRKQDFTVYVYYSGLTPVAIECRSWRIRENKTLVCYSDRDFRDVIFASSLSSMLYFLIDPGDSR